MDIKSNKESTPEGGAFFFGAEGATHTLFI